MAPTRPSASSSPAWTAPSSSPRIDATLPKGLVARLGGDSVLLRGALASAAAKTGRQEQTDPSCPAGSRVGAINVGAGAGPTPFYLQGDVFLAGAYKGAPLSLAAVVPAVAGPFDLGDVVVRIALHLDSEAGPDPRGL